MTLLYLALAYIIGVATGRWLWNAGWLGCEFPQWLWILPLALLPLTPILNRFSFGTPAKLPPMRWPAEAGFEVPRTGPSLALMVASFLCITTGIFRYASHPLTPCWTPTDLAFYNLSADQAFDRSATQVTLVGYISSYPLRSDTRQELYVAVSTLITTNSTHDVHGIARLTTDIDQRYTYGEAITVRGRLVTPPDFEDFSYREYLARKGIHSLVYSPQIEQLPEQNQGNFFFSALYNLRSRGESLLNQLLPEPYAALANGMLLGIEAGIPDELYEQFNLTGTSHTIIISGSNVSVISTLLMALGLRLFGRKRAVWATLLGIGCYAMLVGGDAAVLRAALMGGLFVIATTLERRSTALVSLAAACWVMTLLNPLALWDVGFQLSSAATAGLILFTPGIAAFASQLWPGFSSGPLSQSQSIQPRLDQPDLTQTQSDFTAKARGLMQGIIQDGLLVTIAANITTMPLVAYYFGRLSLISVASNLAISPVQPWIMLWGTFGILVGVIGFTWIAWILLLIPWLSLVWTVAIVQWSAGLPGASLEIANYPIGRLVLTYVVIATLYWRAQLWQQLQAGMAWLWGSGKQRVVSQGAVGVLGIGATLIWAGLLTQPDGRLHIHFLDIGQGDGIFIQTPSGHQVLIDGGESPQQLFAELGAVMPFWDRTIDLAILTHPDADHMDAQRAIPERFTVTTAFQTVVSLTNVDAEEWQNAMTDAGTTVQVAPTGSWFDLGDGVALWVLWPPDDGIVTENFDNENSLVLKLVYGEFSLLLTGDVGIPTEQELLKQKSLLTSTVLKVGHHGSNGSTSDAFLQAVQPMLAVIQAGAGNDYGHPHPEVLERLSGHPILRNDQHGRIHLSTDGHQMWLDTERAYPSLFTAQARMH